MKARKPNAKDKICGCVSFLKDMLIGFFTFDIDRVRFDWVMFKETAKGNFEVVEEE